MRVGALIVAAGRGLRAGEGLPKQYRPIAGVSAVHRAARAFARHPAVETVTVIVREDAMALAREDLAGLDVALHAAAGDERQDTVRNGLALLPDALDAVLIHDAARPFVPAPVIDRVIGALAKAEGAIAALPCADTLRHVDDDGACGEIVPREGLWRAQTPQGFRLDAIRAAHRAARGLALTDDADIARRGGLRVVAVEGAVEAAKLTTAADIEWAERWAGTEAPMVRVGQGYDVHAFGEGDHVMLCGVRVAHDRGFVAHSDGDVAMHAATDAILGAVAAGDIGRWFPPSDPQWKGCDSAVFLRRALEIAREQGGALAHLDITIICEHPKIGPHAQAMRERMAALCHVGPEQISVKATTSERLGFTGRGEGIAAMALATLSRI